MIRSLQSQWHKAAELLQALFTVCFFKCTSSIISHMFTRWRLFVRDCCMQWWRQPVGTQGDNSQKQMQQEFIAIVLEIHKCIRLITESFTFWLNLKRPNRNTACFLTRYLYSAMHIQCHQLQVGSWTVSTLCIWRRCFSKNLKLFGRLPAFVSKQRLGCR